MRVCSAGAAPDFVWVDEAAYVDEEVVQEVILPMIAGVGNRVLIMASTQSNKFNWFNRLLKKAEAPGSSVWCVLFDFMVCTTCRAEGQTECEHAKYLTPPWYNPEKAKKMHTIASRGAMNEMLGVEHGETVPAFRSEAVEAMIANVVDVDRLSQTVVVGVDPNGGGHSDLGLMAVTVVRESLVILGWGIPKVVTDVHTDPHYSPRVVCDFLTRLFDRYGRGVNVFLCVESNMREYTGNLYEMVMDQPFAARITFAREHTRHRKVGILKTNSTGVRAQQLWHSWMHEGAGVAENPVIYAGGARQGEGEFEYVESELRRQFLEFEEVPIKEGVKYEGKMNGNDDLTAGAGVQCVIGTKIVTSEMMRDSYPNLFFN